LHAVTRKLIELQVCSHTQQSLVLLSSILPLSAWGAIYLAMFIHQGSTLTFHTFHTQLMLTRIVSFFSRIMHGTYRHSLRRIATKARLRTKNERFEGLVSRNQTLTRKVGESLVTLAY